MIIREMQTTDIDHCIQMYIHAFSAEPWCGQYTTTDIRDYFLRFISSDARAGYLLCDQETIIGMALILKIPSVGSDYMRIEDFCIDNNYQRHGLGSVFISKLSEYAKNKGMDSILLGTVRDYPSHHFYLKNGFQEITSSVLLFRDL